MNKPRISFRFAAYAILLSLLCGASSVLGQTLVWSQEGDAQYQNFGYSLLFGIDGNGDSIPDIIVGAPAIGPYLGWPLAGTGSIYSVDSLIGTKSAPVLGLGPKDRFGFSLTLMGHLDLDNELDFAIGAPGGSGYYQLRSGATRNLIYQRYSYVPNGCSHRSTQIAGFDDLNANGFADLIYTAPNYLGPDCNIFSIPSVVGIEPTTTAIPPYYSRSRTALQSSSNIAGKIAVIEDVDNDGIRDVIFGTTSDYSGPHLSSFLIGFSGDEFSPGNPLPVQPNGAVHCTEPNWDGDLPCEDGYDPAAIKSAGDYNSDGVGDFIVGIPGPGTFDPGRVEILSGAPVISGNPYIPRELLLAVSGESVFDSFGSSVDFSTDFNDDGEKDIVVGAPGIGPSTRGYISVFSGVDGQLLFSIESDELGGSFGWELLSMPDVSGDGRPEIVVGDPGYDGSAGTDSGRVLMFSAPDCLNDPNKTEPGICGCGVDDSIDGDGDGIPDCIDRCLDDPQNKCNGHLYWEPIREIIFGF